MMKHIASRRDFMKQGGMALITLALPFSMKPLTIYNPMNNKQHFDVIIIGGSYSGLSAGMALGRALRNVLIIDSGRPCNIQTPHSHNFITQDGKTPKEISTEARLQVQKYGDKCLPQRSYRPQHPLETGYRKGSF